MVRGRRVAKAGRSLLVAAGFLLFGVGPVAALTPPEALKADIIYSNGGRILSIKSDGSDRQVLASRFARVENTPFGYTEPAVSPDGGKLAFEDRRSFDDYDDFIADIRVMNSDGTGSVKVLSGDRNNYYSSPSWSPDGQRLIASYFWIRGKQQTGGVVSIRPDGSDRKVIFKLTGRTVKRSWESAPAVGGPVISPDGTKLLFVRLGEFLYDDTGRLETFDLGTGSRKLIGQDSGTGSWSPDGTRVVSWIGYGLGVSKADGSGTRRLLGDEVWDADPVWSPDGSRIVFDSDRNMPRSGAASEVYSVKRDGSCLTWLTNGTPASTSPTWSGDAQLSTDPGGCDGQARALLKEIDLPQKTNGRAVSIWMGQNFRGRLFAGSSGPFPDEPISWLEYSDCEFFEPDRCGGGFWTVEFSMCRVRNLGDLADGTLTKGRGVPLYISRGDGSTQLAVISGASLFLVYRDSRDRMSNRQVLAGMRPFGTEGNPWRLPPPVYAADAIQLMKKVERVYSRSRSVPRTAKRVGISRKSVRQNLRVRRLLRRFGPIRTVKCPRKTSGAAPSASGSLSISTR